MIASTETHVWADPFPCWGCDRPFHALIEPESNDIVLGHTLQHDCACEETLELLEEVIEHIHYESETPYTLSHVETYEFRRRLHQAGLCARYHAPCPWE